MDLAGVIAEMLVSGQIENRENLEKVKRRLARKFRCKMPKNSEILRAIPEDEREKFRDILVKKPSRTLSGVSVIAVMTSPHPCPHGTCLYCPGGVKMGVPQSYTGREPASMRAAQNNYDPYLQVKSRLEALREIGHPTDKIDLIIMGGTFPARDKKYQEWFVKRCFDALNGIEGKTLEEAHRINETAENRCIGLTVETRPDYFTEEEVDFSLYLGATRVELGVQILDDYVLSKVKRGHGVKEVVEATRIAKDAGFKVCYHIMPGLPYSNEANDLEKFKMIFEDERFRPDMLKIYPTLVVEGSELYDMWKAGEYEPLDVDKAIKLVAEMKRHVPEYVRIQRVQRDIPSYMISAGVKKGDLRERVRKYMEERGWRCRCIRCREVGRRNVEEINPEILVREYRASEGKEIFISYEDANSDVIVGYVRLRFPSEKAHRPEMRESAIIREIKVFGKEIRIGERGNAWQHKGVGKKLMEEAEQMAKNEGYGRILVISGVGVREYFRKMGYFRLGPYMAKKI